MKANRRIILSVHSRRPYLLSNFPDCVIVPPVFSSSSLVPSTLEEDAIRVSRVAALFCVVSDKCLEMESILSVTLSCCEIRLERLSRVGLWRNSLSPEGVRSSCLSAFSISNIVDTLAFLKACRVLQEDLSMKFPKLRGWEVPGKNYLVNCCLCESTSLATSGSPSSRAQSSNLSMHFLRADILALPASFRFSRSAREPLNARIS